MAFATAVQPQACALRLTTTTTTTSSGSPSDNYSAPPLHRHGAISCLLPLRPSSSSSSSSSSSPSLPSSSSSISPATSVSYRQSRSKRGRGRVVIKAMVETNTVNASSSGPGAYSDNRNWIPVIPVEALPKGERRLVRQNGEQILLFWYRNEVFAVEGTSPAEGAYSEGLINARFTQDGCIVCPSTASTFDLKTGDIKEWYPTNPMMRFLTRPVRKLQVYPVKVEDDQVYLQMTGAVVDDSAELIFGGQALPGKTATDVSVDEVRMVIDESQVGFGFNPRNEILNGRAAQIGFVLLIVQELLTGKGFLRNLGILDYIYAAGEAIQKSIK